MHYSFYKKRAEYGRKTLSLQQEAEIKRKGTSPKKQKTKSEKFYPMVVFGDATIGEKSSMLHI